MVNYCDTLLGLALYAPVRYVSLLNMSMFVRHFHFDNAKLRLLFDIHNTTPNF